MAPYDIILLLALGSAGSIYVFFGLIKSRWQLIASGILLGILAFLIRLVPWQITLGILVLTSPFGIYWSAKPAKKPLEEKTMDPIISRQSIRAFTAQAVPQVTIESLLEAAMQAPSAGNEQPWHFIVLTSRSTMQKITEFHNRAEALKTATAAIVVCGEPLAEKYKGFWVQDCSAATQNILIAAQSKGLGSVWLGVFPIEERIEALRKLLWIPETIVPFSIVALGYSAENKQIEKRYTEKRVHFNGW